jgi:hypothetical protein
LLQVYGIPISIPIGLADNIYNLILLQGGMESLQTDSRFEENLKHSEDEHYPEESLVQIPHSSPMTPVKIKRRVIIRICLLQLSWTMNDREKRIFIFFAVGLVFSNSFLSLR